MSNWRQQQELMGVLGSDFVKHKVCEKTLSFYPISGKILGRLKMFKKPISLISTAFIGKGNDTTTLHKVDVPSDNSMKEETVKNAVSPELAQKRYDQMHAGIDSLMDLLTDDAFSSFIGAMIMDSLRDVFMRDDEGVPLSWPTEEEFMSDIPIDRIPGMLFGVFKANKRLFGPFGKIVEGLVKKAEKNPEAIMDLILNHGKEEDEEGTDDKPTESPEKTPGSSSNDSTSGSQEKDSTDPSNDS